MSESIESVIAMEGDLTDRMATEMKVKLEANRHKLHWRSPLVQTEYLALRLYEEVAELLAAVRSGVRADAWAEAADVANFAAMLADRTPPVKTPKENE